jgi:signal transduction histidine kinase
VSSVPTVRTVRSAPAADGGARPEPTATTDLGLSRLWRWQAGHPRAADAVLAVAVFAFCVAGPFARGGHDHGAGPGPGRAVGADVGVDLLTTTLLAAAAGALVLRRSHPLLVWAVSLVLAGAAILHSGEPPTVLPLTMVALYTVGVLTPLRITLATTLVTTVVYAVVVTVVDGAFGDRSVTLLAVLAAAAAVGVAVRSQRLAVEAAEARARQAEVTREEEAVRRVTDERLRIAQELHDVLAHHISVINVQAGVARHLMDAQPDAARTALGLVRESSRTVLSEMTTVLGLLRTGEDEPATQPAPGLDRVADLVESMGRAGLRTTWVTTGNPAPLSELADLTAYRVVQESLTNALKHGTGTADLTLDHQGPALVVQVRNPVPAEPAPPTGPPSGGHGLVGMRERVASVGGQLSTGPTPGGTFTVRAEIPRSTP